MARTNTKPVAPKTTTHGGGRAFPHAKPSDLLRRSVLSCMLFEDEFYEDGVSIAKRIKDLSTQVSASELAALAVEARHEHNLRHVSLLLLVYLIGHPGRLLRPGLVAQTIEKVVSRADELGELVALYWKDGKRPLSGQMKKGLAAALRKFDAYQLAKYDRAATVRLRDVLFLTHAKPKDEAQAAVWKQLVEGTLPSPDTWEVALSTGGDKKVEFTRLLQERKLGYLALLRNLRNMEQAGVDNTLVREAIAARQGGADKVLPFRFFAAAKAAPRFEPDLDAAMVANFANAPKLQGKTVVIIDVSGSMGAGLSGKSDMTRLTAACALGAIMRELCENPVIYATAGYDHTRVHKTALVPARRGIALADATADMMRPLGGGGIFIKQVMDYVAERETTADRVIVITDEQDCSGNSDTPNQVKFFSDHNYMVNVASYKNGIGYGKWTRVDGFSESVVRWIMAMETRQQAL